MLEIVDNGAACPFDRADTHDLWVTLVNNSTAQRLFLVVTRLYYYPAKREVPLCRMLLTFVVCYVGLPLVTIPLKPHGGYM